MFYPLSVIGSRVFIKSIIYFCFLLLQWCMLFFLFQIPVVIIPMDRPTHVSFDFNGKWRFTGTLFQTLFNIFHTTFFFFFFLWVGCNHWKITEKFTIRLIFHILRIYFARWTRMLFHRFEVYEIHRKSTILFTCALKSKFILCSRVTHYSEMNKYKLFSNLF